jgi:hypothetical protein
MLFPIASDDTYAWSAATSVYSFSLTLSVIVVLIPAAFVLAIGSGRKDFTNGQEGAAVLQMSHGVSVPHGKDQQSLTLFLGRRSVSIL